MFRRSKGVMPSSVSPSDVSAALIAGRQAHSHSSISSSGRLRRWLRPRHAKPKLAGEPGVAASRYTLTTYGSTSGITLCAKTAAGAVRIARTASSLPRSLEA